jgi:hypothetical protein
MLNAIKRNVTVQPGGRIEVFVPELPAGAQAEVIVLESASAPTRCASPLAARIGQAKGAFASPDDVDSFIRAERDRWP